MTNPPKITVDMVIGVAKALREEETGRVKAATLPKKPLSRQAIVDAWKSGERSKTVLSERFGCSRSTIRRNLEAAGIDWRDVDAPAQPIDPRDALTEEARRLEAEGLGPTEIGLRMGGLSRHSVRRLLNRKA